MDPRRAPEREAADPVGAHSVLVGCQPLSTHASMSLRPSVHSPVRARCPLARGIHDPVLENVATKNDPGSTDELAATAALGGTT